MNESEEIKKNEALAVKICKSFYRRGEFYSFQDLMQISRIAIVRACRNYDKSRGAFSTLIYHYIVRDLIKFTSKYGKKHIDPAMVSNSICYNDHGISSYLEDINPQLSILEFDVAQMMFDGYKRGDILEKLDITHSEYRKAVAGLRRKMKKYV
jgi:DNA-directed RNA polymerase specialized sigma subunit